MLSLPDLGPFNISTLFCFLRQGFFNYSSGCPRLASDLQRSTHLYLLNPGIKDKCHHAQFSISTLNTTLNKDTEAIYFPHHVWNTSCRNDKRLQVAMGKVTLEALHVTSQTSSFCTHSVSDAESLRLQFPIQVTGEGQHSSDKSLNLAVVHWMTGFRTV